MTISSDMNPTPDTDTMLNKMAKAGDVEIDDTDEDDKIAATPAQVQAVVSTVEDLAAAAQAVTTTLHQLTNVQPEVMLPSATPAAPKAKTKKKAKKVAKKAAAKKTKTVAKKASAKKETTASSGQSGPPITDLSVDKLNDKEMKVMSVFSLKGERESLTITQLAKGAWPTNTQGKSNSWTRNSLRRLVRGGFIEKLKRGLYRISIKGRNRMEKAAA